MNNYMDGDVVGGISLSLGDSGFCPTLYKNRNLFLRKFT